MRRSPLATIAIFAMVFACLALILSAWAMKERLADREVQNVLFGEPILDKQFTYLPAPSAQRQDVSIAYLTADQANETLPEDAQPIQTPILRVNFRGSSTDFPVLEAPTDVTIKLPGLLAFRDWFKVLPMITGATSAEDAEARIQSGEINTRLVLVARYLPEGYERDSWGTVRRQDWIYRFAELLPEPASPAITVTQRTYRQLDALHTPGVHAKDEDIPTADERERDLWMHFAMQQVTPPQFFRAKDRKLDAALEAMGWTWPVAGISVLTIVLSGLAIAMASKPRVTL